MVQFVLGEYQALVVIRNGSNNQEAPALVGICEIISQFGGENATVALVWDFLNIMILIYTVGLGPNVGNVRTFAEFTTDLTMNAHSDRDMGKK